MAVISSHILNAVDGSHASGVVVTLARAGQKDGFLFESVTDDGGRIVQEVDLGDVDPDQIYELVFKTGDYWLTRNVDGKDTRINEEVVLRFKMPESSGKYHHPAIISPNGYSTCMSGV